MIMIKVSVIIAAYNAEVYLEETLNSIVNQTIDDFEIIVVNDGSSDGTKDILDTYQEKYANFHAIHKENGGPSSARNMGLDAARGEYVYFFDADDILELDALECLYEAAQDHNADLVIAKYDIFNKYRTFAINDLNNLVKKESIDKYDDAIIWTFSLSNKLFRKSIIDEYHLRHPPIAYSEDGVFSLGFVYHTKQITGLDKVIFHYRRMYEGETESLTSSITPSKIRDYITAHHMILDSAEKSFLRDYPDYQTIEEARKKNPEIHTYLNVMARRELQILLGQLYTKFWSVDEDTVQMLVDEIKEKIKSLSMKEIAALQSMKPDVYLNDLYVHHRDWVENAHMTAVLYGTPDCEADFLVCLKSLTLQSLIGIQILVPETMRMSIEKEGLGRDNILYLASESEKELFDYALQTVKAEYIIFCDKKIRYANNCFMNAFRYFRKSSVDFISDLVYHGNYGKSQPITLHRTVLDSLKAGYEDNEFICMDRFLANKFLKVSFLRSVYSEDQGSLLDHVNTFYRKGYYAFLNTGTVLFEGKEEEFCRAVCTPETEHFIHSYLEEDKEITLNSPEILLNPAESLVKLQGLPTKTLQQKIVKKSQVIFKRMKLKNQTLFFTVRKDGELEGNTKALYPYVKGKKIIFAKMSPHGFLTRLIGFWRMMTSKVIVTDDYAWYLRHFPVRPEQRVIQLWHACGAFKKFGQHGTNLSVAQDLSAHAQYNAVCVSGSAVRPVYADAFGVSLKKVKALGVPRTDDFFREDLIQKKREMIYEKFPDLKGKFVIIYAPTFRDVGKNGRKEFHPELDFDRLSKDLLPDQVFVVCPHPVMKNEIIPREYDNIKVIRDFSTNDMMFVSDMMITDYSSVIFEYALLRKPIAFFCYDLNSYDRGFYLNYPEDLPGDVYETQEALTEYLRNPQNPAEMDKYNTFIEKYMGACDGHSCERIAELINSYMEEN